MGLLEDFIVKSNSATNQEEIFRHFCASLAELGYDSVVYSLLTDHVKINRKKGHGVLCNYPVDWMEYYNNNNYFQHDLVVHHAFTTSDAYTWKQLLDNPTSPTIGKKILHESREARLLDGAAVAIYGPRFEIAGVGLASTSGGAYCDKQSLSIIRVLANQFHITYSALDTNVDNILPNYVQLSPREYEVLSQCAEGKSDTVIASILSITNHGVDHHMRNIFRKLQVNDRLQAVIKAILLGLINPPNVRNFYNLEDS